MQAGYKVFGLDLSPQEDPALQHADYQFSTVDIADIQQTQQVASNVSNQDSGLQVLINNAGIADPYLPESPSERIAHWNKVIQTNLTGKRASEMHTCMLKRLQTVFDTIRIDCCRCFSAVSGTTASHGIRAIINHTHV